MVQVFQMLADGMEGLRNLLVVLKLGIPHPAKFGR